MSYKYFEVNRAFVVIWTDVKMSELAEIRGHLDDFQRRLGKLPVYLAITPPDTPTPSDEARKEMLSTMSATSALTETLHLVLEATGLRATVLRSIAASLFLIAGNRKVFVHHSIDDALAKTSLSRAEQEELRKAIDECRKSLAS